MSPDLFKYPRTRHLQGSRLGPGEEDPTQVSVRSLRGHYLVIEEKVDGANAGLSFDGDANLRLQCRGHYIVSGGNTVSTKLKHGVGVGAKGCR